MLLALVLSPPIARATSPEDLVQAILIADVRTIQPGQPFRLGVLFTIKPDWHIYWKNAGDAGLPTSVKLDLPEGFKAGELQWPTPRRFDQPGSDTVAYGYGTGVLLFTTVTPPPDVSGVVTLCARANWLACEKDSIPGLAELKLKLPVDPTAHPFNQLAFKLWQARIPVDSSNESSMHIATTGHLPADDQPAPFSISINWKAPPTAVDWFPDSDANLYLDQIAVVHKDTHTQIDFTARQLRGETPTPDVMKSVLAYTDPNGQRKACNIAVTLRSPTTRPATLPAR